MWQLEAFKLLLDTDILKTDNGNKSAEYLLSVIERIKRDGGLKDEINEKK
jgi:hypothetical protein